MKRRNAAKSRLDLFLSKLKAIQRSADKAESDEDIRRCLKRLNNVDHSTADSSSRYLTGADRDRADAAERALRRHILDVAEPAMRVRRRAASAAEIRRLEDMERRESADRYSDVPKRSFLLNGHRNNTAHTARRGKSAIDHRQAADHVDEAEKSLRDRKPADALRHAEKARAMATAWYPSKWTLEILADIARIEVEAGRLKNPSPSLRVATLHIGSERIGQFKSENAAQRAADLRHGRSLRWFKLPSGAYVAEGTDANGAKRRYVVRGRTVAAGRANPLIHGYSRASVSDNIRRELHRGRPQAQSVAIALSTARRAWVKRHPGKRVPARFKGSKR